METRILTSDAKLGDDSKDARNRAVQRSDSTESTGATTEARPTYLCSYYGDTEMAEIVDKGSLGSCFCKDSRVC